MFLLGMHRELRAWPCLCPIFKTSFLSFVSQVQEAASRGLKFVSVIPQFQASVSSASSSRFVPVANSVVDAKDVKHAFGDRASLENDIPKAEVMDAATAGVNRRPEPNAGSSGEAPSTQQPGIPPPSEEIEAGGIPLQRLSSTLDGPEGEPSNGREEHLSSKCQSQF